MVETILLHHLLALKISNQIQIATLLTPLQRGLTLVRSLRCLYSTGTSKQRVFVFAWSAAKSFVLTLSLCCYLSGSSAKLLNLEVGLKKYKGFNGIF